MKIKSSYALLAYLLFAVCTTILAVFFFIFFDGIILAGIAGGFLGMAVASLFAAFNYVSYIEIEKDLIIVKDLPFFASKKELKNSQLQTHNNCIQLDEIESYEIVTLTKEEKKQYIGQNHVFSKYIKIKIKNSDDCKYIYVSMYSKKQIDSLLNILSKQILIKIL